MAHTLTDNRHGLVVNARVTHADRHAEREAAKIMINDARQAVKDASVEITLGADKGYDAQEFIEACDEMKVTPHVAQNTSGRRSAVSDMISSSAGYAISQQKRKLIEQGFGWAKTVGAYAPGDGAWVEEGGTDVRVEHGRLQPRAPAIFGTSPSIVTVNAEVRLGNGLKTLKGR